MEIYLFVIVIILVLVLAYVMYQLILLNKTKDELIRQVSLGMSEVIAIQQASDRYYEEPKENVDGDTPNINPHDYLDDPVVD